MNYQQPFGQSPHHFQQPLQQFPQQYQPNGPMPVQNGAVVNQMYCVQQPTTLILQETIGSFSKDDFIITDQNRNPWFVLDTKAFSFRGKRTLFDNNRNPILTLEKKMFSFGNKWSALQGNVRIT
jgi:hypothetical protein